MSTLAEIEAAVPGLTLEELDRLEARLRELRHKRIAGKQRPLTNLAQFAGVLRLAEDPLEWQRRIREDWE
jgi:hypothetical protein